MGLIEKDFHAFWLRRFGDRQVGHAHFWERALSRRQFFGAAALAGGAALGTSALAPVLALADTDSGLPNPIKGGTQLGPFFKHFYFPTLKNPVGSKAVVENGSGDGSTIRDFIGHLGVAEFPPTGAVSGDPLKGNFWAADIRFMKGLFMGRDNALHQGALAFI
jgi:hypothetical protein